MLSLRDKRVILGHSPHFKKTFPPSHLQFWSEFVYGVISLANYTGVNFRFLQYIVFEFWDFKILGGGKYSFKNWFHWFYFS